MGPHLRLVIPPLALPPDQLRLPARTNQNGSSGSLERGDHCISLRGWNIQPRSTGYTVQLHVNHFRGNRARFVRHNASLLLLACCKQAEPTLHCPHWDLFCSFQNMKHGTLCCLSLPLMITAEEDVLYSA